MTLLHTGRLFIVRALVPVLFGVLASGSARAATFAVSSTDDQADSDPLDGICAAPGTGACTLRAAIMQANSLAGADMITVPAGVYQITRLGADDNALHGDLDISDAVTIQGAGSAATIIDGNGDVTSERVLHLRQSNAISVTLNGIGIRNGKPLASGTADNGGGISAKVFRLFMNDVRIENNTAARGGGLYSDNCELFINGLTIVSNHATLGAGGGTWAQMTIMFATGLTLDGNTTAAAGGGLWADNVQVEIRNSRISNNTAQTAGGGLALTNAHLTKLDRTELFGNAASDGGALNNATSSTTTLTDCSVHDNHATSNGGAIHTVGPLAVVRTTVHANSAVANGGGMMIPGLNLPGNVVEVRVENSTLSGNTAQFGGAIYYNESDDPFARHSLVVRNSTVAANQVSRDGAGIYTKGIARVFASSATIARNVLHRTSGSEAARGGGIFSADNSYVSAENTIIGDNFFRDADDQTTPDDIYTAATTSLRSTGYNLIETTTNYTLTGSTVGCIFGQDPQLDSGGVANNGGPTPTLALLSTSPAINAGNTSSAPGRDQRRYSRSGAADIGAFEFSGTAPIPPTPISVVSRKVHGSSGTYDINVGSGAPASVECRSGGLNGIYQLVATFANPATLDAVSVTSSSGFVNATHTTSTGVVTVNLSGVVNPQTLGVTLRNVSDGGNLGDVVVPFRVVVGDTTGNGSVTASDIGQVKGQSGQAVTGANFRTDVTANGGSITASDIGLVKSASGTQLP